MSSCPILAYADALSVRPGFPIRFHAAAAASPCLFGARVVRVLSADPNPAGPGIRLQELPQDGLQALAAPNEERIPRGSYGIVPGVGERLSQGSGNTARDLESEWNK